ncbi:hypothetical protein FEM48_Zijuj07G0122700 [Ziziphus jujuba var. spinosa]|uniref:Bifunctional inhibitor/plant lipid transfer protein/seed storage helical domain-containing protein n=1 Tax=Ziziphus jujuba var. spinosa TaxID=714518 RepID=A0A978V4K8_ZIZJJ|nr:hypothetical protein FEM48_Zijuj07G0122700 [Ziziphus jujuba var. spinosa]
MTMLWVRSVAQQSDCTNVLISMAPCLNYVSGSSSTPSSSCCSQLANVVQKEPQCLCVALNGGGASLGININKTLALALPGACNVRTPPVSRCDAANGPATSVGSPEGSKTVPVTGGSSSSMGVFMKMPLLLHFVPLVVFNYVAIYAST